ncbi:MAG: TetR/AcrR family transcriptional regulator, partial [Clostridiales bacterium]|nr:TetR/AcrR family transcriptional regulator [Clostridiales bacterium]
MARVSKPVEERKQEIIDTAKALFIENGFDKTQVAEISKKMNVAQGLIYRYFQSKTEILYAVIDQFAAEKTNWSREILEKCNGTAMDGLVVLYQNKPSIANMGKLLPSMCDPAINDYCEKRMGEAVLPILVSLITRGNEDGSWRCEYPEETAVFILQGVRGLPGFGEHGKCETPINLDAF